MISRRDVVKMLGGVSMLPAMARLSERRDKLDRIGLALFTVRPLVARDFEGTLAQVAAAGYRDLDMYIYEAHRTPKETRAALDRAGLSCTSARVAGPALYRGWERSLDAARELGARWITLANLTYEEHLALVDYVELADVFNRVGAAARACDLTFCYHSHDFELTRIDGKVPLDLLLASTDPALVKLQMDVYWMIHGGRDPVAMLGQLGSRVASLHLKDMDRARDITTVGSGTIDFASILAAAKRAGVRDYYVEEDAPRDPLAAIGSAYRYLANLTF
ncbi:MAG TPA: sugar phosphate isomerase/epimerase [Gemmatimonadaceae bacterium]|nr:sugar phosphate isomerase/epimerase [Gemmatimonadaceae bacterium]